MIRDAILAASVRGHLGRVSDGTIDLILECDRGVTIKVPLTSNPTGCPVLPGLYLGDVEIIQAGPSAS